MEIKLPDSFVDEAKQVILRKLEYGMNSYIEKIIEEIGKEAISNHIKKKFKEIMGKGEFSIVDPENFNQRITYNSLEEFVTYKVGDILENHTAWMNAFESVLKEEIKVVRREYNNI